jgi:hypothetical protein
VSFTLGLFYFAYRSLKGHAVIFIASNNSVKFMYNFLLQVYGQERRTIPIEKRLFLHFYVNCSDIVLSVEWTQRNGTVQVTAEVGENVTFGCTGLRVWWSRQIINDEMGIIDVFHPRFSVTFNTKTRIVQLHIANVQESDTGTYGCFDGYHDMLLTKFYLNVSCRKSCSLLDRFQDCC